MLISRKKQFIFIHIYKTAGTSITKALMPFSASIWRRGAVKVLKKMNIPVPYLDPQPFPPHIKATEIINEIGTEEFKSFFSFAIVRNPWDWQVSLYNYMLRNTNHFQHELIKELNGFDEYIRWRCRGNASLQKDFIYSENNELLVDFLGKFEQINKDFQKICSQIGVSATLPKINVSNTIPYQEYYNDKTKELVRKTFEPDISLFEYKF